jgi:CBS-domain-containing membrane protein
MATVEQTLEEVEGHFGVVSGLPVVDSTRRCVGVVVKSDCARASHGVSSPLSPLLSLSALHTTLAAGRQKNKERKRHPTTHTHVYKLLPPSCFLIYLLFVVTVKDKDCTSDELSSNHTIM